jgi:hypothetical protein
LINAVVVGSGESVKVLFLVVERVTEENNNDSELLDAILDFEHRDNDNDDVDVSVGSIEVVRVGRVLSVCDTTVDECVATALTEKEPLPEETAVTEYLTLVSVVVRDPRLILLLWVPDPVDDDDTEHEMVAEDATLTDDVRLLEDLLLVVSVRD